MANFTETGVEAVVRGYDDYMAKLGRMDSAHHGLGQRLVGLGTGAAKAAAVGLAAVGAGLVAVSAASVKTAADFESQIAIMSTAVDPAVASMEDLSEVALLVGSDTALIGVSATEAADAMTGMFKAGLDVNDVLGDMDGYLAGTTELTGALRAAVDLQAASELDLAQASEIVAIAMATYGLDAGEATRISNNFVQAADASVASVSDLAEAMKNVGPNAAALGISLEDTNNTLAILSTRGISGAEAGTALKSMLTNLNRPTKAVTEMMDKLGVSLYDSKGQFVGMRELIGRLGTAMAGMTDEEKNLAIQTIAGTYGMKALNTLLAEGTVGWDTMAQATAGAAGVQEIAAIRTATFQGAMEALGGVVETLKIRIGNTLLPILTDLAQRFAGFVTDHMPQIIGAFQTVVVWLGEKLPAAIQGAAAFWTDTLQPALQGMWTFIQDNLLPVLGAVVGFITDNIVPILVGLGAAIIAYVVPQFVAWATAAWATAAANIAALAPILIPIAAIGAAVGLLVAAWTNNWFGIRDILTAVWENTLRPVLEALWEWLQVNVPLALQVLAGFWNNTLLPALQAVWAFIQDNVIPIFEAVGQWLGENIPLVVQALADLWQNVLLPAIQAVWSFMQDTLIPVFVAVADVVGAVLGKALEALAGLWQNVLQPALAAAWSWLSEKLQPAFEAISGFIRDDAMPILKTLGEYIRDTVVPVVRTFVEEGLEKIREAFDGIKKAMQPVIDFLEDMAEKIKNLKLPAWLTPGSPTPFQLALEAITNILKTSLLMALEGFNAAFRVAGELWRLHTEIWRDLLIELYSVHFPTLVGAVMAAATAIVTAIDSINTAFAMLVTSTLPAVKFAFAAALTGPGGAVEQVTAVQTATTALAAALAGVGTSTLPALKSAFVAAFGGDAGIRALVIDTADAIAVMEGKLWSAKDAVGTLPGAFQTFQGVAVGAISVVNAAIGDETTGLIKRLNNLAGTVAIVAMTWHNAWIDAANSVKEGIDAVNLALLYTIGLLAQIGQGALSAALTLKMIIGSGGGIIPTSPPLQALPVMARGQEAARSVNLRFGDVSINNGMDWATFKAGVRQVVTEAVQYG